MADDFTHISQYLQALRGDIYPQKPDPGHTDLALSLLAQWLPSISTTEPHTVLDIGCGQGFCQEFFELSGWAWTGVTLGEDYTVCKQLGLNVHNADMSFLPFADDSFTLGFARHVAEHSPMPLLTLLEWNRVIKEYLIFIVPKPSKSDNDPSGEIVGGRNHYALFPRPQWEALLKWAGWKVAWQWQDAPEVREYRYFLQKVPPPRAPSSVEQGICYD